MNAKSIMKTIALLMDFLCYKDNIHKDLKASNFLQYVIISQSIIIAYFECSIEIVRI